MPLINDAIKADIERILQSIEREFRRTQGLILTEDDLKCLLYGKLRSHLMWKPMRGHKIAGWNSLSWRTPTEDRHIYGTPIHTEVSWFDANGKLTIKPDITILEPRWLSILHGNNGERLPEKQFVFGGEAIIFELTFIRERTGADLGRKIKVMKDFSKVRKLRERLLSNGLGDSLFCYFVIFNKTDNVCAEFSDYLKEIREGSWYKTLYATGNVNF